MANRTGVFSGDGLIGAGRISEKLGREVGTDEANKFASLAEVDEECVLELMSLAHENSRVLALGWLGFVVADDGASREELVDFVDQVVRPRLKEQWLARQKEEE